MASTTSSTRPRLTSKGDMHPRSPRYRIMSTSGCSDDRVVTVTGLPPLGADALVLPVLNFLECVCGTVLAHYISADHTFLSVTFEAAASAEMAVNLGPGASALFPSEIRLPPLLIERRKADPKQLAPSSPIIVLKNLAYDVTVAALQSYLGSIPGIPAPLSVDLQLEGGRRFLGVAFAVYASIEDAALVMQAVHGSSFAGRTVKAEYKRIKVQSSPAMSAMSPASFGSPYRMAESSPSAAAAFALTSMTGLSLADVPFLSLHDVAPAFQLAAAIEDAMGFDSTGGGVLGAIETATAGSGSARMLLPPPPLPPLTSASHSPARVRGGSLTAGPGAAAGTTAPPASRMRATSREFTPHPPAGAAALSYSDTAGAAGREVFSLTPIVEHGEASFALRRLQVPTIRAQARGGAVEESSASGSAGSRRSNSMATASAAALPPLASNSPVSSEDDDGEEGSSLGAEPTGSESEAPQLSSSERATATQPKHSHLSDAAASASSSTHHSGPTAPHASKPKKKKKRSSRARQQHPLPPPLSASSGGSGGGQHPDVAAATSQGGVGYQLRPSDGSSWRQREAAKGGSASPASSSLSPSPVPSQAGSSSASASASTAAAAAAAAPSAGAASAAGASPALPLGSAYSAMRGPRSASGDFGRAPATPVAALSPAAAAQQQPQQPQPVVKLTSSGLAALTAAIASVSSESPSPGTNVRYSRGPVPGPGFQLTRSSGSSSASSSPQQSPSRKDHA